MGSDGGILDDLWEYNPNTNDWVSKAPYGGSERKNAIAFVVNGKAYVGTGKGYSGKKDGMEEYTPGLVLGIEELVDGHFTVFPNPSQNSFQIVSMDESINSFALYSTDGKLLKHVLRNFNAQINFNHSDVNAGVYMLVALDKSKAILKTQQIILL